MYNEKWMTCRVAPILCTKFIQYCEIHNIEQYTPMRAQEIKPRNKRKPVVVMRPAFPGYSFVRDGTCPNLLRNAPGYRRFIIIGGRIAVINPHQIEAMRRLEVYWADNMHKPKPKLCDLFKPGMRVRFSSGPFEGMTGTINRVLESYISVLLEQSGLRVDTPPELAYPI